MDLKRKHAAEGLTRSRLKRQFGLPAVDLTISASSPQADQHDEAGEQIAKVDMVHQEPAAFDLQALAAQLRQDVIDDKDLPDDESPSLSVNQSASEAIRPKRVRLFFGTQFPLELKDIFNYEGTEANKQGLGLFKRAGMANLQMEREIYALTTQETQQELEPGSEHE